MGIIIKIELKKLPRVTGCNKDVIRLIDIRYESDTSVELPVVHCLTDMVNGFLIKKIFVNSERYKSLWPKIFIVILCCEPLITRSAQVH